MKKINSAQDIDGATAVELRNGLGLSQRAFWGAISVSSPAGCSYETGRIRIPAPVKRLLFLQYVAGIPTDLTLGDAQQQAALGAAIRSSRETRETVNNAAHLIERGLNTLNTLRN